MQVRTVCVFGVHLIYIVCPAKQKCESKQIKKCVVHVNKTTMRK